MSNQAKIQIFTFNYRKQQSNTYKRLMKKTGSLEFYIQSNCPSRLKVENNFERTQEILFQ